MHQCQCCIWTWKILQSTLLPSLSCFTSKILSCIYTFWSLVLVYILLYCAYCHKRKYKSIPYCVTQIYFLWKDISFCINKMAWKVKKIFKEALDCYMYLKLRYWRFFMFSEKPSNFSIWLSRRCKLARCSNLSSPSRVLMVFAA